MGESAIFRVNGSEGSGYLAIPSSGKGDPVIVIQEWWGLVGHIKSLVDRFAAAGEFRARCNRRFLYGWFTFDLERHTLRPD